MVCKYPILDFPTIIDALNNLRVHSASISQEQLQESHGALQQSLDEFLVFRWFRGIVFVFGGNRRLPLPKLRMHGVSTSGIEIRECTLPETNMAPENGWLEDDISFWGGLFLGAVLVLRRVFGKVG